MLNRLSLALGAGAGAVAAGSAVLAWAFLFLAPEARRQGRALAEADARQAVFTQLQERSQTNADVDDMSDADLCAALGGVFSGGECR